MTTRSSLSRLLSLIAVLVLALTTVACDGDDDAGVEDDPHGSLRDAVERIADYAGVELVLGLSADDAARAQMLAESDLSEDELELLLDASVLIRAAGDEDEDGGTAEFVVTVDGGPIAELRILPDTDVYLRVDLDAALDLVDDPSAREDLESLAEQAEAFGLRDVVEAAQRGEWVRITGLEQLMNLVGGQPQPDTSDEAGSERMADELADAAARFVDEDVTVTYVGSDDVGERVRATTDGASLRRFLDEVNAIGAASTLGAAGMQDLDADLSDLPDDASVSFDAWISDGRVTQLAVDLAELDEEGALEGELFLLVAIDEFTGSVDAPGEASEIDLFGLIGGFMGGLGGFDQAPFGDEGEDPFDDGAFDEGELDEGELDEEAFGSECLTEDELEQMRSFLDDDARAEFDAAVEAGMIPTC